MRRGQGPEFASGNTGQVVNEHLRSSRQQCAAFERPSECAAVPGATEPAPKHWQIEVKPYSKPRSNPQCRYLNGVAYKLLGDATGYERDDISEYLVGRISVARQGASGQARCSSPAAHNDDGCRRQAIEC